MQAVSAIITHLQGEQKAVVSKLLLIFRASRGVFYNSMTCVKHSVWWVTLITKISRMSLLCNFGKLFFDHFRDIATEEAELSKTLPRACFSS